MKVVVGVRTRNEERNVENFCASYKRADRILVADGGSIDNTIHIASKFPNVEVRHFDKKIYSESGGWRNPRGSHQNFLIDWAKEEGADWMIFDDCDCRPNSYLKHDFQSIMKNTKKDFIYAVRLYIWGTDRYFPRLSMGDGNWLHSLWAWKLDTNFRFKEDNPWLLGFEFEPEKHKIMNLDIPYYCLLHYPWQDEEMVRRKMEFYNSMPESHNLNYPLGTLGKLEELPSWAKE